MSRQNGWLAGTHREVVRSVRCVIDCWYIISSLRESSDDVRNTFRTFGRTVGHFTVGVLRSGYLECSWAAMSCRSDSS